MCICNTFYKDRSGTYLLFVYFTHIMYPTLSRKKHKKKQSICEKLEAKKKDWPGKKYFFLCFKVDGGIFGVNCCAVLLN